MVGKSSGIHEEGRGLSDEETQRIQEERMHRVGRLPRELIMKYLIPFVIETETDVTNIELIIGAGSGALTKKGRSRTMHWETADRILTHMGRAELWHTDPDLNYHYQRMSLVDDSRTRLTKLPGRTCRLGGCPVIVTEAQFCSDECHEKYKAKDRAYRAARNARNRALREAA